MLPPVYNFSNVMWIAYCMVAGVPEAYPVVEKEIGDDGPALTNVSPNWNEVNRFPEFVGVIAKV
jgi:hypothetical protein